MVHIPNWCDNTLIVTGPEDDLTALEHMVRSDQSALSFERFLPTPPALDSDSGSKKLLAIARGEDVEPTDWHSWRLKHWGTKWDVTATVTRADGRLQFLFDSAWSPPIPVVTFLSQRWPTLTFCLAYDEGGCDFGGYVILRAGELLTSSEGGSRSQTWADAAEWVLDEIGYADRTATGSEA